MRCFDCGADLRQIGEVYMLTEQLWWGVSRGVANLCIGDFEDRLGRELYRGDFSDHQQNFKPGKSKRMQDRLTRTSINASIN